ncbi:pyridoxal phosphate-dependent decarboxylase family protein [Mucilaginibacter gotjawali]|uniref:Glutamate/tyrosine decarboxylase-like PLP-dependent enzyme n=2 Tax=Mucilaginibacter gotjawali TaxID=1550579 RepID=A0A839S9G8_9SPHI|nr:aminotransferase class V-fold PLP-dependent enzyme [Mucilaginibacter gotjawali]MBB3053630.1 glutamate/tyrosine decarboxylase-like PLP-dependent enzyme [Mucilaginibacter gotjawali]BAU53889.1 L-2,4-diaminobutyrate decarboxylase [Mucilaginibacter gotjawali]
MEKTITKPEIGLDPADWNDIKTLGYQIIDDMVGYLKNIGDRPAWTPIPQQVKEEFKKPLPQTGTDIFTIYEEFKQNILPYPAGNIHPKFFAWVQGTGTPMGALADLLAGVMNSNATIGDQSALYVDKQVIDWCKELMNYPADGSGILVSGGSIANITGLIVARNTIIANAKNAGVYAANGKLTAYCSSETHNCLGKAAEVIGIGSDQLRKIPVDKRFQIDIEALKSKIREDKAKGFIPFCIIGNAGTVNTGAIDPLDDLLQIAREENIWFHIDGAFGALAKLSPAYQQQLKAIEQADSVAFDLHKWMYMQYEVGCVLFKNAAAHRAAFATAVNYLTAHERGLAGGPETISNYGMELSRGFKALKVWMSLKEHGLEKYSEMITQNINQAFYLGEQAKQHTQLELMAEVTMNIVCFRFNPGSLDTEQLNILNKELLMRMHEAGIAAPSYTLLNGNYVIRAAITNHRTRKVHLDEMVAGTIRIGDALMKEFDAKLFKFDFLTL